MNPITGYHFSLIAPLTLVQNVTVLNSRDLAAILGVLLMFASLVLLLLRRKHLGKGREIFIAASTLILLTEGFSVYMRITKPQFNPVALYAVTIGMLMYFLFLLYFHSILENPLHRKINAVIIATFVLHQLLVAVFVKDYFYQPPFLNYFLKVVLLSASILIVLKEILSSNKVLDLENYFPAWATVSIMITYVSVFPLVIAHYAISYFQPEIFFIVLSLVNILGSIVLLLGIIKAKKCI